MPTTVITPSNADNWIETAGAATNHGASTYIVVGEPVGFAWGPCRGLLRFDLAAIPPGSKVISATLQLILMQDESNVVSTVSFYRVLRNWTEMGSTWNTYDGVNNWQTAGCAGALDRETVAVGSFTVPGVNPPIPTTCTAAIDPASVEAWVSGGFANNGWLLKNTQVASNESDDAFFYASKEHATVAWRPQLTVVWTPGIGRLPTYIVDGLQGGITLKATVEQFANETWVRHTPVGGALTRTPAAHSIDAASQAKFGRKDQPLSGGAASATIADQISDTYLSFQSTPNMPDITLAPGTVIKDQNGNVVPQEEIRPNNWMLIENLALPTSAVFSSLTANPMALFIEEVAYDETSGLGITAGRDRFTQALVARIAGRGGG